MMTSDGIRKAGPQVQAAAWTLAALACVLAWDASGLDLQAARLFGSAAGFALRDDPWLFGALHEAPRWLAWLAVAALCVMVRWPAGVLRRIPRADRVWLVLTIFAALAAVAWLKRTSATSCPWDLREFGGTAAYVSHWIAGVVDGGGGHCFPAGHASSAFAWVAGWFALRRHAPGAARAWLACALLAGAVLGLAQQVRGAHYMSHTLWTAWICWCVAWLSDVLRTLWQIGRAQARASLNGFARAAATMEVRHGHDL
jgi:membrane-associated PAP2 superfamily phosphatase